MLGFHRLLHLHFLPLQIAEQILALIVLLVWYFGQGWGHHFLGLQLTPAEIFEKVRVLYLVVVLNGAFLGVFLQQPGNQLLAGRVTEEFRKFQIVFLNLLVNANWVVGFEPVGQSSAQHLE